jgi:hypothetical protein
MPVITRFHAYLWLLLCLAGTTSAQTTWLVNNLTNIGGNIVTKFNNPQVISTPYGNAVQFNGINDGLVVSNNPLTGMTNLTVEMIFRHDTLTVASAWQPRIVHIQSPTVSDHRITLETRVSTNVTPHTFLLDSFLKYGGTAGYSLTLSNAGFPHPVGVWSHMAATFDGTNFCNYVNARLELSGTMNGRVFTNGGATWIGQRNNNTNYFQGAVLALRFTPRVLATNEFMCVPRTRISTVEYSNQNIAADFALTNGLPIGFTLQEAAQPGGPWSNSPGAVLTTNTPDASFRFTASATNDARFYRVHWP